MFLLTISWSFILFSTIESKCVTNEVTSYPELGDNEVGPNQEVFPLNGEGEGRANNFMGQLDSKRATREEESGEFMNRLVNNETLEKSQRMEDGYLENMVNELVENKGLKAVNLMGDLESKNVKKLIEEGSRPKPTIKDKDLMTIVDRPIDNEGTKQNYLMRDSEAESVKNGPVENEELKIKYLVGDEDFKNGEKLVEKEGLKLEKTIKGGRLNRGKETASVTNGQPENEGIKRKHLVGDGNSKSVEDLGVNEGLKQEKAKKNRSKETAGVKDGLAENERLKMKYFVADEDSKNVKELVKKEGLILEKAMAGGRLNLSKGTKSPKNGLAENEGLKLERLVGDEDSKNVGELVEKNVLKLGQTMEGGEFKNAFDAMQRLDKRSSESWCWFDYYICCIRKKPYNHWKSEEARDKFFNKYNDSASSKEKKAKKRFRPTLSDSDEEH